MKLLGLMPVLASLSLVSLLSCPASLAQATGSYDFSDNSGDQFHTNEPISGQIHDDMGYGWNTGTGTGNSQTNLGGGTQVQTKFGKTHPQSAGSLSYANQSLLSGMFSNYPFSMTSIGIAHGNSGPGMDGTGPALTYGFNQKTNLLQNGLFGPISSIIGSTIGLSLPGGYGLYGGVDYYRELMNGNLHLGNAIPTPLQPTGTSSVSADVISPESYGHGMFANAPWIDQWAIGLIGGFNRNGPGIGQIINPNPGPLGPTIIQNPPNPF